MKSWSLPILLGLTLLGDGARATVLRGASVEELAHSAAVIFHGRVASVDDDNSEGPRGPFTTVIELEVLTPIKGMAKDERTFVLELPGGRAGERQMRIPGMPRFVAGEEVVLLLERTARGFALAGLGQGVFRVSRAGAEATVQRELGDVLVLGKDGKPTTLQRAPRTLDELLATLHGAVTP